MRAGSHRQLLQTLPDIPGIDRPITLTRAGFKLSGAVLRSNRLRPVSASIPTAFCVSWVTQMTKLSGCEPPGQYGRLNRPRRSLRKRHRGGRRRSSIFTGARLASEDFRSKN